MRGTRNATIVPHGEHLQIEPSAIEFTNIQANMRYIQTLVVKNLSPFVKRIRCEPPATEYFSLVSENKIAIAPGLAITIDVAFMTRRPRDYQDKIVLKAEDVRIEVPLSAKAPCAIFSFDTKVNFGTVMTRRVHQKSIWFRNTGTEPGDFEIAQPSKLLKLQLIRTEEDKMATQVARPAEGPLAVTVPPGGQKGIKVELFSDTPCTVHESLQVRMDGGSSMAEFHRTIEVQGKLLDQKLHVLKNDAEVTSLDFGNIYQGQTKTIKVMLVNDGPTTCGFNAHVTDEGEGGSKAVASSPSETVVKSETPLTVTPFTGQVPAFGRIPMEFKFAPAVRLERKGFVSQRKSETQARTYTYAGSITSEELNFNVALKLVGRAVMPALKVSPDMLDFGECAVNQRRDIVLRLTNSAMPDSNPPETLDFSIPRVPHMEINPMKGRLAPQQNQNIIVSFTPKALGNHHQDLVIKYCNGLFSHSMRMYAEAPHIGEKKIPTKGLEKTGRDFDPEHTFVQPDAKTLAVSKVQNVQSLTKIMKAQLSKGTQSMDALRSIMEDLPEPTPYSLSPAAMQEHVRNKQKYNKVLKDSRKTRRMEARKPELQAFRELAQDIFLGDDFTNRGMVPGSGLKSPRLCVDEIQPDAFTLGEDDSGARGVTGHRYQHDENKFIKKKFKGAATSPAEQKDCSQALANEQLGLISVGPAQLDFGTLYVKSQGIKSFSVYNDLPQAILVALQFDQEDTAITCKYSSQVVPSAHAAGFDIVVSSPVAQTIQKPVGYLINGIHQYKLWIKAEIIPVQIRLSRHEIPFRFSEESLEKTLTETLTLTNNGNAPACFTWQGMNSNFSVTPTTAIINRLGGTQTVEVTFTPPANSELKDAYLTLKTVDGEDQMLHCSGQVPEANCAFVRHRLELSAIAVGLKTDKEAPVVNNGRNVAVFHVESVPDGVTVSPMRGRIPAEGRVSLEVHVLLQRQMTLEGVISLNIRGGRPIRLPITATGVVPSVVIQEDELDFGELRLGTEAVVPVSLKNASPVEGTLYVNFQDRPEFALSLLEGAGDGGDGENDESSSLTAIPLHVYHQAVGSAAESGATSMAKQGGIMTEGHTGGPSPVNEDEDEESHSHVYKINVAAHATLQLQLTYKPDELGRDVFDFPIVAAGGGKTEGLKRVVHYEALRPRMVFGNNSIDFKTKVVATGVQAVASAEDLMLGNADDYPIEWKIDVEPLKKFMGAFTLEPSHGVLAPNQEFPIRANFLPNEPIEYKQSLNVYISPPRPPDEVPPRDGEPIETLPPDESKPYQQLKLRGQGTVPKLGFDRREIVLPIVPLNIRSRCLFHIINEGYESLEVKYRLPTDTIRIPLSITFPEGQQLGITKPKIPVEIHFQSNRPISFCAKIEFLDNDAGSYKLPVCGTTDNSILTCHHYLTMSDYYTLEGEPVQLREKEDGNAGDGNGPAPSVKTGSVSHQSLGGYGGQDTSQVDFLVRWMNGTVLKNPIDHFPQDLIVNGGKHLLDMIEFLSGRQVSSKGQGGGGGGGGPGASRLDTTATSFKGGDKSGKQKSKEWNRIQLLLGQYETLLNHLKQNGAYLSSVRPEHFLSSEQYLRWYQSTNHGATRRQIEKTFYSKSLDAWLSCILQTIKIFLLNRTTLKLFRGLPGMSESIDQPVAPPTPTGSAAASANALAAGGMLDVELPEKKVCQELVSAFDSRGLGARDSNACSPAECVLLRWLNFHYWRANNDRYPAKQIMRFDEDLEDSTVLATVIRSHVPTCAAVENLRYPCATLDHYEENAMHIIEALQEIGLQFPIQPNDIASPQPKDMLLFVLFLFQNLQHYVPKTSIVFSTMLGVNMTKHIELTNPSKKAITYTASLQGSSDFTIKEDTIRIEPRQTASFPVEFQSRFSRQVDGRITFTSRREGATHAAAMVFKLQSECTGRRPRKTETVSAVLYEVGTVDIDVENPYNEDAEFQVNLREMTLCDADKNPIRAKRCENIEPFHLGQNRVRVKANGTSKLTVSFLPFEAPAFFVAYIGFFDTRAGEFYYEILGESSPPSPLETLKIQVKAGDFGFKEIIFPHNNVQMQRARSFLENKGVGVKQTLPDSIVYDVKLSSPYYQAPKQVTVVNSMARQSADKARAGAGGGQGNPADRKLSAEPSASKGGGNVPAPGHSAQLRLEFKPKEPGVYPCTVTLTSDIDIRIYQVEGIGTAPNTYCSLTFNTQARKYITQEIPIVNSTERDWIIKPHFAQSGHEFDGPREFTAKKRQPNGQANVSCYPLTFKPDWICDVKGQLLLQNTGTQETYEYDIQGIAEEPLAEEHVIISCEAREKTSHKFVVKNYSSQPAAFEVESDLVHISGPSSVQVEGRGQADYELVFQPLQTGTVTGCIMFRDLTSGHFTWYTVQLKTLPPKPQQVLQLRCVVRQAVAVDIQLVNPLDDVVVFEVDKTGDGLLGDNEFVLAPKEIATYELVFSPLMPSRKQGYAAFFNDLVGEFWYDLELIAEPAPPEELPLMECELGRTASASVKIENPTGQEVQLKHRSTNKINFKVLQQRIVLPPLETVTVNIEYSPASLNVQEDAQIFFEHPTVGQWVYRAQGIGLPPTEPRKVQVVAQVGRPISSTITFKNPFLETIHALILLESRSEKGVFSLLNKKAKVQIGPLASTQIPFSFNPPSMTQHTAELAVSVSKQGQPSLTWSYQIQGVAEAPTDSTLHTFAVQARESLEQYYLLSLAGLEADDRISDALSCQLEVPPQYQALVNRCFGIELEESPDPAQQPRDKSQASLRVRFAPLKPFVAQCNLVITRATGGRWRFEVKLEATEPEVDDTISIQSPLNKPASVAFRLCNHTSAYSEFDAFFDAESAYEFTVQPTSGVLEPQGTSGTTFIITYKPTEYGKPVQGKLIIQTEDVYWSYAVRGTHPKYSAPVADQPRVGTRLDRSTQQRIAQANQNRRQRNFIRSNMKPKEDRD